MSCNRSFARRIGKSLSNTQKFFLENSLPNYIINESIFQKSEYDEVFLEIGFGMGEHFAHQAELNVNSLFLGAEVYLNGVANILKLAQERNIHNIALWPNDFDLIIDSIPDNSLNGIYLLFPDPWNKRKQQKNRFLNQKRIEKLQSKLKYHGFFVFVSDIKDYFTAAQKLIKDNNFEIIGQDTKKPHPNYIVTKYHKKALEAGREIMFLYGLNNNKL